MALTIHGTDGIETNTDTGKIKVGTGDDLQINHDGTNSLIQNSTGYLGIQSDTLYLQDKTNGHAYISCVADGAVGLRYDNVQKLETTSGGVASSGQIDINNSTANAVGDLDDPADYGLVLRGSSTTGEGTGIAFTNDDKSAVGSAICHIDNGSNNIGHLAFYTSASSNTPVEKMRIASDGKVYLGTTSSAPDPGFYFNPAGGQLSIGNDAGVNTQSFIEFRRDTTQIGSVTQSGTTGVSFNTGSDYRLKENQVAISDGITRLKTLKPYRFNFKAEPSVTVDGFFAHEVTAVPEAIVGTKDKVDGDDKPIYQQIDQSKLVPLLTAALQEAIAKIETLETKVAALEAG